MMQCHFPPIPSPPGQSSLTHGSSGLKPYSTLNLYLKSAAPHVQIPRSGKRNLISFRSGKGSQLRNSLPQKKGSLNFAQETNNDANNLQVSSSSPSTSTSLLSFLCPLLKLFSGGDPSQGRNYLLEEAASSLSTLTRLPWGSRSLVGNSKFSDRTEPLRRLQIFEFEACPFCRRVREALTELDLSAEIYPCPKGSIRHRETVRSFGGKEQFPFLVDPNTGVSLYESSEIVKYLFQQYGKGQSPSVGLLESTMLTGWMPTLIRAGRGMTLWEKSKKEAPTHKLELFSYENNPYARIVREALCELELPYNLQNVGKGSIRAPLLLQISGSEEVPYLVDPNTGQQMGDCRRIIDYLFQTYSVTGS